MPNKTLRDIRSSIEEEIKDLVERSVRALMPKKCRDHEKLDELGMDVVELIAQAVRDDYGMDIAEEVSERIAGQNRPMF